MAYGTPEQLRVLREIAPEVATLTQSHEQKQRLWMPSELVYGESKREVPPEVAAMLVLNLLTEEGLPYFHALLVTHLGVEGPWRQWTNLWTAEEDRHGTALSYYLRHVRGLDMVAVERAQYEYLRRGFMPEWQKDPYQLLAYTVLQERATQVSYQHIAAWVRRGEPVLEDVLSKIGGEEAKHFAVYRKIFARVLKLDPVGALRALARVIRTFEMPGGSAPCFADLAYLQMRKEIFTPLDYKKIVEDNLQWLGIGDLSGLPPQGERLVEKIMQYPKVLARSAEMFDRQPAREVQFTFLPRWKATF